MKAITNVSEIANWRLCLGCGACAYICPEKKITLVDFIEEGVRPVIRAGACGTCSACLDVCPGYENDHRQINVRPGILPELAKSWGPVLEVWEGHAADMEIRMAGSSGGLLTALCLYCLERKQMHGVVHIGGDPENPLRNKTALSRSRQDLLDKTGSRYAPASACDRLDLIESAPGPCVFVGQPSEVTALAKAEKIRPQLKDKVGLSISFFCAGSPATLGTLNLLKSMGIDAAQVKEIRYRGNGWPGMFAVTLKGQSAPAFQKTYAESWGFLQAYRPFSVHLFPDGTGEDADISCGDPWYRPVRDEEPGSSLVIVRTERGREIVRGAMASGYVCLEQAESHKLKSSQQNLLAKRGAIWGRILMLRVFGLPVTRLRGFSLFDHWRLLSLNDKLRSTLGTARRIITRKLFRPLKLEPKDLHPSNPPKSEQ
jgi:coenzyme F420 hydrogenase subunit beta